MDSSFVFFVVVYNSLVWAVAGAKMGSDKGQPVAGFFLGLVAGPLGLVLLWASTAINVKICPYCREQIKHDALLCRYCQHSTQTLPQTTANQVSTATAAQYQS